jgi:hypothetical protein
LRKKGHIAKVNTAKLAVLGCCKLDCGMVLLCLFLEFKPVYVREKIYPESGIGQPEIT